MVISVCNRRGGCGKSTTVECMGAVLSRKKKVLYIDMDSQVNLTSDLGVGETEYTSFDVLAGKCKIEDAITGLSKKADIIPGSHYLSTIDSVIEKIGSEHKLEEALEGIKDKYDYILIDTPPSLDTCTANALTATDWVVIPLQAEINSLNGAVLLYDIIQVIKKYSNKDLKIAGLLLTRYSGRARISQDMKTMAGDLADKLQTSLFDTVIRENVSIKEAQAMKRDILDYAPKSNAATDYTDFTKELLGKIGGKL